MAQPRDKILTEANSQIWTPDLMKMAIASRGMQNKKNNQDFQGQEVAVLCHNTNGVCPGSNELKFFLQTLNANAHSIKDKRFQIAAYVDDKHWIAIDIEIKSHQLTYFVIDTISNRKYLNKVISEINQCSGQAKIYNLNFEENPIQKDGINCSRFTLHNLYTLQKINTFDVLADNKNITQNENNSYELNIDKLPVEFAKLLRPDQTINRQLPDYLQTVVVGKNKDNDNQALTLADHKKKYMGSSVNRHGEEAERNTYIEYKKNKFISHIKNYMAQQNDAEIESILKQGGGHHIISSPLDEYLIEHQSFHDLYEYYKADDISKISSYLSRGVHSDSFDQSGKSALMYAIHEEDTNTIGKMLSSDGSASIYYESRDRQSALFYAVKNNLRESVTVLLKHFDDINHPNRNKIISACISEAIYNKDMLDHLLLLVNTNDRRNKTPYMLAVEYIPEMEVICRRLLKPDEKNIYGYTRFHQAVKDNNLDEVKNLLKMGDSVNVSNSDGETSLATAAKLKNQALVDCLLPYYVKERSKDINSFEEKIHLALLSAIKNNDVITVHALLEFGANPNFVMPGSVSPLSCAINRGSKYEVIKQLLQHGADPKELLESEKMTTALHYAVIESDYDYVREILEKCKRDDAVLNINIRDAQGKTALHYATINGDVEMMKLLLEAGANPDIQDNQLKTPLHYAAISKNEESIRNLLSHKANSNIQDSDGNTGLHYAMQITYDRHGNLLKPGPDYIQLFLDAGARKELKNNQMRTPYDNANLITVQPYFTGHQDQVDRLNPNPGAKFFKTDTKYVNQLLLAVNNNDLNEVVELLKADVSPDAAESDGLTVLHIASRKGSTDIVKALLNAGANPDKVYPANSMTALHFATSKMWRGNSDIILALLNKGANPNAQRFDGATPLHAASLKGDSEAVRLLLINSSNHTDPDLKDNNGKTAIELAQSDKVKNEFNKYIESTRETQLHDSSSKVLSTLLHNQDQMESRESDKSVVQEELASDEDTFDLQEEIFDDDQMTPLQYAACIGDIDYMLQCLEMRVDNRKINVNQQDVGTKWTTLHFAVDYAIHVNQEQGSKMIQILLKSGANPNIKNTEELTAISLALNLPDQDYEIDNLKIRMHIFDQLLHGHENYMKDNQAALEVLNELSHLFNETNVKINQDISEADKFDLFSQFQKEAEKRIQAVINLPKKSSKKPFKEEDLNSLSFLSTFNRTEKNKLDQTKPKFEEPEKSTKNLK